MSLRSVMVQLDVDQIERLDREAARIGVSRSQMVRDAVDVMLNPPLDATLEERYAEAYPELTLGTDDWGDIDAWHAAAAATRSATEPDPW